jgi:hypothetical protein
MPVTVAATRRRFGRLFALFGQERGSPKWGSTPRSAKNVISAILLPARVSTSSPYARDLASRAREVAAEGGLTVGPRGDEPERPVVARITDAEEVFDCLGRLVLVGIGRHRQPRVVGEQGDDRADVAVLERVRELPDYFALVRGVGEQRSVTPRGGQAAATLPLGDDEEA